MCGSAWLYVIHSLSIHVTYLIITLCICPKLSAGRSSSYIWLKYSENFLVIQEHPKDTQSATECISSNCSFSMERHFRNSPCGCAKFRSVEKFGSHVIQTLLKRSQHLKLDLVAQRLSWVLQLSKGGGANLPLGSIPWLRLSQVRATLSCVQLEFPLLQPVNFISFFVLFAIYDFLSTQLSTPYIHAKELGDKEESTYPEIQDSLTTHMECLFWIVLIQLPNCCVCAEV